MRNAGKVFFRRIAGLHPAFAVVFVALASYTVWLLVRHRYLPGTDMPFHAMCSRVWMDAGRAPYAAYEPRHLLEPNTLLYDVTSILAVVFQPLTAFRIALAYYFVGLPIACWHGLRAFGRSPWGALLAFPLCYNEAFSAGFVDFYFAAPTFVFAFVESVRLVERPSLGRANVVGLLFIALFLSHVHAFVWLAAIVGVIVVVGLLRHLVFARVGEIARFVGCAIVAGGPSALVFRSWYTRTYGHGHEIPELPPWMPHEKFAGDVLEAFASTLHPREGRFVLALLALSLLALALHRTSRKSSTTLLPHIQVLAVGLAYLVLPDTIGGQTIAPRQWYMLAWLLPLAVTPVEFRIAPRRALVVIVGITAWVIVRMSLIALQLERYDRFEMYGLDHLARTAPGAPGLRIAYVALDTASETWKSQHTHEYAFVAAERSWDGPFEQPPIAPVRYRGGDGGAPPVLHVFNNPAWYRNSLIWTYDMILVRRWKPVRDENLEVRKRADLVAAGGDWELWRTRPVVQTAP